ncbi:protein ENHANCED DOWNY MILDEW 2-like isoform X3 [Trifolium pratense]|uniref:protein ENHANCED DOWNY MILDEW 2-like isoform X3 n=1 Tax=Trifolium pratense TaxID=57577 RepID=UPI001E6977C8|nr:protein ENHANCED DOWNY MILDEW 2-like isoform X3 [Trifolium pratense]
MLYKILSLMEEVTSNLNMEEFKKDHQIFSSFTETAFHKNVTQGKVEGSVKAIKIALQKLNEGCSIEEAKAICGPEIVRQLFTWKKQLKVYLAPFLHGMRYTSFGRHFTKIDELKEFSRHYPLDQKDLVPAIRPVDFGVPNPLKVDVECSARDYTPPQYLTLLFTDLGIPSGC